MKFFLSVLVVLSFSISATAYTGACNHAFERAFTAGRSTPAAGPGPFQFQCPYGYAEVLQKNPRVDSRGCNFFNGPEYCKVELTIIYTKPYAHDAGCAVQDFIPNDYSSATCASAFASFLNSSAFNGNH